MPTYEYECPSGHRYETREGFDAPATQKCIRCRKMARRVLFAPPIVFKGSGFYVTDSRKAESAATASSDAKSEKSAASEKSEPSSNGTSEKKSDTKAESKEKGHDHGDGHRHSHDSAPSKDATPKADKAKASS